MRLLRNKTFSDKSNNETPKRIGEALGTALVGTAGTIGAADFIKSGAKKVISKTEGVRAKKDFKEGVKKLDAIRKADNFKAEVARGNTNSGSALDLIFHKRNVRKADQKYKAVIKGNEEAFKSNVSGFKKKLIGRKNANIAKKTGRVGKAALGIGLAATGIAAGMKLKRKKNED